MQLKTDQYVLLPWPRRPGSVRRMLPAFVVAEWFWAPLWFLGLCAIFFWPVVWYGAAPLPLANAYFQPDPVWAAHVPNGAAAGANRLLGDVSGFYYPYLAFTIASLRAGQLPLWNPDLFGGMPFFAANQAALLYPLNWLAYPFGAYHYWAMAAVLRLMVAGCGTYALSRRLGVGPHGALLAGSVYMFAAFNVVWLHFAIHNVAALLPLALWLIARLAERPNRRDALALASVVAAQMFGGHPEMSLFFMVVCGVFALAWLTHVKLRMKNEELRRRKFLPSIFNFQCSIRSAAVVVLAVTLGLGLSAVQWLPTIDLISRSYTLHERGFAADHGRAPEADFSPLGGTPRAAWSNLRHWMLLVAPELWGWPAGDRIRTWLPERTNYNELASYVGLATLPLALLGALRGHNRRAARFFGLLLLVSLLLLYPLPGLYRIGYLPLLDVAYGFRFGLGIALGAALLAGLGLDRLLVAGQQRDRLAVAMGMLALAALNGAIVYDLWGGTHANWALGRVPDAAARATIAEVYNGGNWRLFVPGAAGLLAGAALLFAGRRRHALLTLVVVGELLAHGFGYNGFIQPEAIYPTTPLVERLTADGPDGALAFAGATLPDSADNAQPVRVLNLDGTFWANSAMTHGIQVVGGMDDLAPLGQQRFLARGMAGVSQGEQQHVVLDWGQRLLDLMGVRYIVSQGAIVAGPDRAELPLELHDGTARLYRNEAALPHAYAATKVLRASAKTAEDRVFSPTFDPHRAVVLEESPPELSGQDAPIEPVAITSYTPNRVELAPELSAPAVVVLADSYDADWRVTIDGQPARLLRANAAFRGVVVPAGVHKLVFSYQPVVVGYGALLSIATLLACLGWLALSVRRRRSAARLLKALYS
jgi:hypothetical protein